MARTLNRVILLAGLVCISGCSVDYDHSEDYDDPTHLIKGRDNWVGQMFFDDATNPTPAADYQPWATRKEVQGR